MTAKQYRRTRRNIGSQRFVAGLLKVHPRTISQRERGVNPITREAELALRYVQQESEK